LKKSFCISHVKDVDGIGAAALVVAATGAEFILADYDTLMDDLAKVPQDVSQFVLSDIGTDDSNRGAFVDRLGELATRCSVTYVDHHYLPPRAKLELAKRGVKVVHDPEECASMLCYSVFKDVLPPDARFIALYGAVTDYQDDSPMGLQMMEKADRQFVLAEATLLALALGRMGGRARFPELLVRELAAMRMPHEIGKVPQLALQQLKAETRLATEVREHGTKLGRLAYMETSQYSTGNVAKLLIGAFDVPVGVSYKEKQKGWVEVSLRSTSECKIHLGQTIGRIALKLGGSGGGHRRAAGCHIRAAETKQMVREVARLL